MTRILVTGAGGFAGAHFFEHILSETDWDVVATDSFRHKGKTDRIAQVIGNDPIARARSTDYLQFGWNWRARTDVILHDLVAPFSEQAVSRLEGVDYIVAYASESHVDRSITDPVPFVRNNVDVALNTLELARKVKPKALVWISTDEVCGPVDVDDLTGHSEWGPLLPSNPYAGSKAAQEAIATSYWRTYGVPLVIVRCMNMIGERQEPEKFVPMTIGKVNRGDEVVIHGSPGNIGTRHYLHSRNLADGILFLLQNTAPSVFPAHHQEVVERHYNDFLADPIPWISDRPDMYNIASSDRIDNLTLAQMIADYVGKPLNYKLEDFHTTRPGHDPHYGLNPAKLQALGWDLPVPFEESLKRTVAWTLEHPEWMLG